MNTIYLIIGLIIGFLLGWMLKPREISKANKEAPQEQGYISEPMEEKTKNLAKIRAYIKTRDQVTNNAIEHLLGVSDATTIRYLDELEKEGLIRQIGKSGPSVYYQVYPVK